ncbi:MAG: hypothetical protein Q8M16_05785 [Pirellulaceae bacterium]|nr:hypothetical protein [Pirellulaceae bacterium]
MIIFEMNRIATRSPVSNKESLARPYVRLLAVLVGGIPILGGVAWSMEHAVDRQLTHAETVERLKSVHASLNEVRRSVYGNCFIEGVVSEKAKYEHVDESPRKFNFWSRDGSYFRFDEFDNADQLTISLVVRPEGYVLSRIKEEHREVAALGSNTEGMLILSNLCKTYLDSASTAGGSEIELAFLTAGIDIKNSQFELDANVKRFAATEVQDNLVIEFENKVQAESGEVFVNNIKVVFRNQKPHVVCSVSFNSVGSRSSTSPVNSKVLQYDELLGANTIPVQTVSEWYGFFRTTRVTAVEFGPQPWELFHLEEHGFGSSWVWFRRLAILCGGIVLFGLYLIYRRKKKSMT